MNQKKLIFFAFLIIEILLLAQLISASIQFGNLSHYIEQNYTRNQTIKGWINISLFDQSSSSLISGFNSNITIKKFLEKNNLFCSYDDQCSCIPQNCESTYSTIGNKANDKTYSMNVLSTKLFGIKISDNISQIKDFRFNVSTNAKSSCITPIMIDLLDDGIDWKEGSVSTEECFIEKPFGCFDVSNLGGNATGSISIGTERICEKIKLPPLRGFKIGANIMGNGSEIFTMSLDAGGIGKTCNININSGGKISCNVVIDNLNDYTEGEVCIFSSKQTNYKINFEDQNVCGYLIQSNGEKFAHDYEIFAYPLKYAPQKKFTFNNKLFNNEEINLTNRIFDYIAREYNKECSPECIIPIRIYSGVNQQITVSDSLINYNIRGHETTERGFYDINESSALMTSDFLKLDLEKADIFFSSSVGEKIFVLNIGNLTITQNIKIINIPKIKDITPNRALLSIPTNFIVILDTPSLTNITYKWDFGDNTTLTTNENRATHVYSKNATYKLSVAISNQYGETSKNILVTVGATYEAINNTIKEYKKRLKDVEDSLSLIPEFDKKRIYEKEDIEGLKSTINRIDRDFKEAFQTDYIKIMNELTDLKVPNKFFTSTAIKPSKFSQNKDRLNPSIIGEFGAGESDESIDKEEYYKAVNNWLENNLEINVESATYSFYYDSAKGEKEQKDVLSNVKLILTPRIDIEEFYLIIEGNPSEIKIKESYSEKDLENGVGIRFSNLVAGEKKEIEFLYPGMAEPLNLPIYLSPEFRKLEFETFVTCNNNGICEADSGENITNCRADCKPWKRALLFLGILILITFIAYIILQEWYKRNYEKYLFKDKNQLFNLITFISNSLNQKLSKNQIFEKLRPFGWNNEQLNYAWKKLNGKRTGMWEIPIFMPFERMKVKSEIEKRKSILGRSLIQK